jgi:hypothetical protein
VRGALQAQYSNDNIRLNITLPPATKLNAWSVLPAHDVWSIEYAGDKMAALETLVWLNHDIEEMITELFALCVSHPCQIRPWCYAPGWTPLTRISNGSTLSTTHVWTSG